MDGHHIFLTFIIFGSAAIFIWIMEAVLLWWGRNRVRLEVKELWRFTNHNRKQRWLYTCSIRHGGVIELRFVRAWKQNRTANLLSPNIMELSFLTPTKFSTMIEEMVAEKHLTYMDACLEYCKDNNIEPESLGRLVNKSLKQKIQVEAENLHFLQKSSTLPLWWKPMMHIKCI